MADLAIARVEALACSVPLKRAVSQGLGQAVKALGLPLYRLLGGSADPVPACAGGFALGYAEPAVLAEEALSQVAAGYRAVKLRLGDTVPRDTERTVAMRAAVGDDIEGDGTTGNPLRTRACSASYELGPGGTVTPLEGPGLGVAVDEDFIRAHPITRGPARQ